MKVSYVRLSTPKQKRLIGSPAAGRKVRGGFPDSADCGTSRQVPSRTLGGGSKAGPADGAWHLGLGSDTVLH